MKKWTCLIALMLAALPNCVTDSGTDDQDLEGLCDEYCAYMRQCGLIISDETEYRCDVTCLADAHYYAEGSVRAGVECTLEASCSELHENTQFCPGTPPPEGRDCIIIDEHSVTIPSSCYGPSFGGAGAGGAGGAGGASAGAGGASASAAGASFASAGSAADAGAAGNHVGGDGGAP